MKRRVCVWLVACGRVNSYVYNSRIPIISVVCVCLSRVCLSVVVTLLWSKTSLCVWKCYCKSATLTCNSTGTGMGGGGGGVRPSSHISRSVAVWVLRASASKRNQRRLHIMQYGFDSSPDSVFVFETRHAPLLKPWQVLCLTINVIMGSGFLGVPSGFADSGLLLGPLVLILVTVAMWLAALMLCETAARAHSLLTAKNALQWLTPTLTPFAAMAHGTKKSDNDAGPALMLPSHTSYELMMLCRMLLGRMAERLVMVSIVLYMAGTLVSHLSTLLLHELRMHTTYYSPSAYQCIESNLSSLLTLAVVFHFCLRFVPRGHRTAALGRRKSM